MSIALTWPPSSITVDATRKVAVLTALQRLLNTFDTWQPLRFRATLPSSFLPELTRQLRMKLLNLFILFLWENMPVVVDLVGLIEVLLEVGVDLVLYVLFFFGVLLYYFDGEFLR